MERNKEARAQDGPQSGVPQTYQQREVLRGLSLEALASAWTSTGPWHPGSLWSGWGHSKLP